MLPRSNRFSPRVEAPRFFQQADTRSTQSFYVFFERTDLIATWKAAVIVPKKVSVSAVKRNKIKRFVRFLLSKIEFPVTGDKKRLRMAIVVKPAILKRDLAAAAQELLHALMAI